MKIFEFVELDEAKMHREIKEILKNKGYKYLGRGQDQDVYITPDGSILKIFGYEPRVSGFSRGQRSFIDFANFCKNHPDNPFLPQFEGWETFKFKDQLYLQIKCERLFEFKGFEEIATSLESLVEHIMRFGAKNGADRFIRFRTDKFSSEEAVERLGKLIMTLGGKRELYGFAKTVDDLYKLSLRKGYTFDLHHKNFMLTSEGQIVINDPFFTGTFR